MNDMTFSDVSQAPPPPAKKNSKVIIIVVVVLALCCLCLVVAGGLAYWGTKGGGPLASLATETPTRTPTRTPTITPTPTLENALVGYWTIYFSWDCTGDYNPGDLVFYDDYTYNVNDDATLWGTWFNLDDYVDFTFDEYPNTHYIGTITAAGDYMEGTMDNLDGMTGCWYALR